MLLQATSIFGAVLILIAYAGHQAGWTGRDSYRYHLLNSNSDYTSMRITRLN